MSLWKINLSIHYWITMGRADNKSFRRPLQRKYDFLKYCLQQTIFLICGVELSRRDLITKVDRRCEEKRATAERPTKPQARL